MKWLIVSIVHLLGSSLSTAQYFNNTYNNISAYAELSTHISILDDGSYLIPSVSASEEGFKYHWRKLDSAGLEISYLNLLDTNIYLYSGIADLFFQGNDGSYYQGQIKGKAGVTKYYPNGDVIWDVEIDSIAGTNVVMELEDGNLFTASKQPSDSTYALFWLDENGFIFRSKSITPIDSAKSIITYESKVLEHQNILLGGFAIFYRGMSTDVDEVMLRVDSLGNVLWTKIWDDDIQDQLAFFCDGDDDSTVVMPINKVVWYADNDNHFPYTAYVGTTLVNVNTGDTSSVFFPDLILDNPEVWEIIRTPDQGYCLMGDANDDIHSFTFLMKLDQNRELEWYKTYAPEPPEMDPTFSLQSWDIEITPDSGFVVCGEAIDWGIDGPDKQMPWVFKTDYCGELEWNNCGTIHVAALPREDFIFNVFPNPAKESLTMTWNGSTTQKQISIFDATGHLLYEQSIRPFVDTARIETNAWPSGVYVVRLIDENGRATTKRVVKE
jgi:hypothetical protein